MRIAHVAPVIYPVPPVAYGGTERVVADLAHVQLRLGHEVAIFAPRDSTLEGVRVIGDYGSLSYHRDALGAELPAGFAAQLEAQQLRDIVKYGSAWDIIHLHGSFHSSGICAALGLKVFRTIHWRADEADHQEHFETFRNERMIAISQRQARDVPPRSLAGVVHHGIPVDRYRLAAGRRDRLLFIGRMTDQKRPDRAIELANRLGLRLDLAGPVDAGNPTYFADRVAPHIGASIHHVGSLSDSEKQTAFDEAAALVFPIDWPEPFGLVMIEAMACGVPVIAWDNGSVREVIDDGVNGIVVSTIDEAVSRWPEVCSLDSKIIRGQFETRFTVDRMAAEVLSIYENARP